MRRATYNTVNGSTIFGEQHNNIERHCKMKGSIIHYERATYNTVNGSTIFGEQHNNIERHCKMEGVRLHYEESDIQYSERQYNMRRATQQYWATLQNEGIDNTLWGERHTIQWTAVRYAESNTTILSDTAKWREWDYIMRRATYNTVSGSTICGEQHNNIERQCKMKRARLHYEESDIQYSERQYDIRRATQQYWATLQNEGIDNTIWGEWHTI